MIRPYEPMEINRDEVYPLPPCEHDELMRIISVSALEHVVNENGQRLAEEMALYYYGKEEPIIWE